MVSALVVRVFSVPVETVLVESVLVEADPVVSVFAVRVLPVLVESVLVSVVPDPVADVVAVEDCWVVLEAPVCVEAVSVRSVVV